ncbi:MAG: DUF2339 domain-containing protein [Phycisphaeraceae bacterium]|nr:DUF2339 domain-containing protein [Phycisphaeraceae bacterium]
MEILIFLIVLALLGGLFIGPIGFLKAMSAGSKAAELQQHLDRLELELNNTRTLCFQLRADLRAIEQPTRAPQPTDEPVIQAKGPAAPKPATDLKPIIEASEAAEPTTEEQAIAQPPAVDEPTTLRHLLDLQQQQRAQKPEQPPIEHTSENTGTSAIEPGPVTEPMAAAHEQAAEEADEPIAPPVSTQPPIAPYDPAEPRGRRLTIEEVLAGKVFVWIGAIALVLTAAFLLKLGFDRNIITEPVRVIGAAVFGLALWCVGEWARTRVSLIAQALCGAGVAVLYGTIIAAEKYQLLGTSSGLLGIDSGIAFGLMGLVTAAAVVLSLRHGPAVAILGMLGGFMMPPLLVENMSPTLGMVLYLIAIEVGVLAITGKRGWFGISLMTLVFSVVWSIGYTLIGDQPHERTLTAMLVLGTAAAYIYHTARIHRDPTADHRSKLRMLGLSIAATFSAIAVCAVLAVKGGFSLQDLSMLGVAALGTLVLARIDPRQIAMPFVAMAFSALVLLAHAVASLPAAPTNHLIAMCAGFGGMFLLGGYACLWGNTQRKAFATMCAIAGPAFYGIVFFAGHEVYGLRSAWWPFTLGLAGVYALAVVPMLLRRKAEHDWPIALFSVLSFVLVCISLGQAINHPWFAVSLTAVSVAAALIDLKLFIRPLRVAASIVAFLSAGLLVVPGPFELTIHGGPVFNTLLPMYLLPAIAFAIIALAAKRAGSETTASNLTWLCMATASAVLLVLIRDIYQPANFLAEAFHLYEWSTYATVLLLACFLGHWLADKLNYEPILAATRCIIGVGAILALIGGLIPGNPLFHEDTVGGAELAAGLFALYAAPAALMWLWSRRPSIAEVPPLANALRVVSITLVAVFVGLQIRNGFAPDGLRGNAVLMVECIAYAVAWILLGGVTQSLNRAHQQNIANRVAGQVIFGLGLATTLVGSVVVFNPLIDHSAVGGWGLVWRLAVLYIVPAALMWLWSHSKTLADQPKMLTALRGASIAYLTIFVGQLIRNAFHYNDLHALSIGMFECATYGLAWVALGFLLHAIGPRCTLPRTTGATGRTVFGVGLLTLLLGNAIALNPLWFREIVGTMPVFNGLWYLYAPLILILALLARHARRLQLVGRAKLAGFMAVGLSFMLLSMFVRHGFSGDGLVVIASNLASAERYAYSLAWVVFGGVLLVAGVFTRLDTLRYGSLAVLLLAVGKVFLIDTASLDNLYRVFSFFGLGVTLIALGYLYQRLVFKRPLTTNKAQAA